MQANLVATEPDPQVPDLTALAWLRDELTKSIEGALASLKTACPGGEGAAPAGAPEVQTLQAARDQLHQALGALDMTGLAGTAPVLGAMESAVQAFIDRPALYTPAALAQVEQAGFALCEFLDSLLAGRVLSPMALFPQYRAAHAIGGPDNAHPADLWPLDWTWQPVQPDPPASPLAPDSAVRSRFDAAVLRLVKAGDGEGARELAGLCAGLYAGLSVGAHAPEAASFWCLAAAVFEGRALGLLPDDLYLKRAASGVLVHYTRLAKGDAQVSLRLARELLFFCAQAGSVDGKAAPCLSAVRRAWGLAHHQRQAYDQPCFGQFDPVLLKQVQQRLAVVRDGWSALAAGDASRGYATGEQINQLGEALCQLHPPFTCLADVLAAIGADLVRAAGTPRAELALEAATAILFLDAVLDGFHPSDSQLAPRARQLAQRLETARQGAPCGPLEPWMEDLYRRRSDRQTLGTVVSELRLALAALEQAVDGFSRAPQNLETLREVPAGLSQLGGILSVLGLDTAARAVAQMRQTVQAFLLSPEEAPALDLDALGSNLGALGFLINMLGFQPALVPSLFVFDEVRRELRPVSGRSRSASAALSSPAAPAHSAAPSPVEAPVSAPAVVTDLPAEPATDLPDVPPAVPEAADGPATAPAPASQAEPVPPAADSPGAPEPPRAETIVAIGGQQVPATLLDIYLAEADDWSLRLENGVRAWAIDAGQPVPAALSGLAHALAGSSSTVGLHVLADLARRLESSLLGTQRMGGAGAGHAQAYLEAAQDIRRLLHQFAAGIFEVPTPGAMRALEQLDQEPAAPEAPGADAAVAAPSPDPAPGQQPPDAVQADLLPFFLDEANDLVPSLGGALRRWQAQPQDTGAREQALRALHTLKGSARLAGAPAVGTMAHQLESAIEDLPPSHGGDHLEPLLPAFDALQAAIEALRPAAALPSADSSACAAPMPSAAATAPGTGQARAAGRPLQTWEPLPPIRAAVLPSPAATAEVSLPSRVAAAVRVRSDLLERLMDGNGQVMVSRARLEAELGQLRGSLGDLTGNLERLRGQLRDIEVQAESQMQSRLAQAKGSAAGFDPLEFDRFTRVQELTRMMAESVNDVATVQRALQRTVQSCEDDLAAQARQTRGLQRDLLRTRMVGFESIAERLHGVVRLASRDTGRQAQLELQGEAIEMDRGVLERMAPVFEHLLRNAVAHGIEDPAQRLAAGKPPVGRIRVALSHEGNDVALTFEDDGAGLDLVRIRDRALSLGLLREGEVLDESQAADLIFTPGFSTATEVTELAGRGIGMDVVRAEVRAAGGRIDLASRAGQGMRLRMVLPLTTAVTQVVMLRCGRCVFGVPASLVESVQRASVKAVQQAYNSSRFECQGESLDFHWGGALLHDSPRSVEPQSRALPVVVLRSASQGLALHVDQVLGHEEVVVKNLGPQLARLPGLAGMTVAASGAPVLIYNPGALAAVHGEQARAFGRDLAQPHVLGQGRPAAASQPPWVLVVDDSITVRRVTQRLLEREGYRVALASDGLQALEQLAQPGQEPPVVVLSDIEMPRMDGFELARHLRDDPRWADLPIVMITSRSAAKHRAHALQLGVNHYLGKPYPDEELLALVRRYAAGFLTTA